MPRRNATRRGNAGLFDDLRVRVEKVTGAEAAAKKAEAVETFELDASVNDDDLARAARVSAGLDRLAADFDLDSLAYYHRGLDGEVHERLGAGMILGASLLTARGVPAAGEYELRTSLAMLIADRLGAGGSFTELQVLDFRRGHVEMGHDGPAHLAISARRPLLRGLGVYHGKRGYGVSVEFRLKVTRLGLPIKEGWPYKVSRLQLAEVELRDGASGANVALHAAVDASESAARLRARLQARQAGADGPPLRDRPRRPGPHRERTSRQRRRPGTAVQRVQEAARPLHLRRDQAAAPRRQHGAGRAGDGHGARPADPRTLRENTTS